MDEFEEMLLKVIDETLRYSLGDRTVEVFYKYLKGKGFSFSDIPQNPDFFFNELRKVLEFEGNRFRGSVSALGTVSILERAIIEILCRKLGVKFDARGPIVFSEWVKKVREAQRIEAFKVESEEIRR
ncbi:MAG: hypothetical protein ACPLRY_07765 [Candidatus Bathyarchaeales archaeon]